MTVAAAEAAVGLAIVIGFRWPAAWALMFLTKLTPGGSWMIVEPYAGDRVEENLNPIGRAYYAGALTLVLAVIDLAQLVVDLFFNVLLIVLSQLPRVGAKAGPRTGDRPVPFMLLLRRMGREREARVPLEEARAAMRLLYDDFAGFTHAFLIREPERVIASYLRQRETVAFEDLGLERQAEFFEREADRLGHAPPVIDANDVLVVGAGIGGLTLALALHRVGIACRVYDAAADLRGRIELAHERLDAGDTFVFCHVKSADVAASLSRAMSSFWEESFSM